MLAATAAAVIFALASSTTGAHASSNHNNFDPYQNNGGLVAAVSGKDFVAVACDTRMVGQGGYDILSRREVSSRLWSVPTGGGGTGCGEEGTPLLFGRDGSILIPPEVATTAVAEQEGDTVGDDVGTAAAFEAVERGSSLRSTSTTQSQRSPPPVFVASAGCSSDCEQLKRAVRSEFRAARYFAEISSAAAEGTSASPSPGVVASALSQILYSRRGFPFYSFCVVAGIDFGGGGADGETDDAAGATQSYVYGYDAIGSYERVAVATAGTGRELLQPILDRKFSTLTLVDGDDFADHSDSGAATAVGVGSSSTTGSRQLPRLQLMHRTQEFRRRNEKRVSCTRDEAVTALAEAYRSVAEREIGVGDRLVVVTVQRGNQREGNHHQRGEDENDRGSSKGEWEYRIQTFPLKEH